MSGKKRSKKQPEKQGKKEPKNKFGLNVSVGVLSGYFEKTWFGDLFARKQKPMAKVKKKRKKVDTE